MAVVLHEVLHTRRHLVIFQAEVVIPQTIRFIQHSSGVFSIEILLEPKDSEIALITNTVHMYCLLAEEIDDPLAPPSGVTKQDPRSNDEREYFFNKDEDLHLIHGRELRTDFVAVKPIFPMCGHVVREHQHLLKVQDRIMHFVFIWESSVSDSKDTDHEREPEYGSATGGDFEAEKELVIPEREEREDCGYCTADHGDETAGLVCLVFGELLEVVVGKGISLPEPALKEVV